MNKYRKYYKKKENKVRLFLDDIKSSMALLPFSINEKDRLGTFDYFTFNLSSLDNSTKNSVMKMINKYNTSFLYLFYIKTIAFMKAEIKSKNKVIYDYYDLDTVEKSFIESGLAKEIKQKENDESVFEVVLPNDETVIIGLIFKNQNILEDIMENCHSFCNYMLDYELYKNNDDVMICTGIMKYMFDHDMYHTIIVEDGIARDFTNNIQMPLEDYINLFDFKIVNLQDKISYKAMVNRLNKEDVKFKDSHLHEPLRVAIHKQMNKKH